MKNLNLLLVILLVGCRYAASNTLWNGLIGEERQRANINTINESLGVSSSTGSKTRKTRRNKTKSSPKITLEEMESNRRNNNLSVSTTVTTTTNNVEKMPSVFTEESDKIYDKYAACLAATEGLRRVLQTTKEKYPFFSTKKQEQKDALQRAYKEYLEQSSEVITSLGLSVTEFNQLGKQVNNNSALKEKVMEQACLYRMASTVNMGKIPFLKEEKEEDKSTKSIKTPNTTSKSRERVQRFVQSITEIEDLRLNQTKKLAQVLKMDTDLPLAKIKISDPELQPLLDPKIRAVVQAFPYQANEIVKKYGFSENEFNQMLKQTRSFNPIFKWRIQHFMSKNTNKRD